MAQRTRQLRSTQRTSAVHDRTVDELLNGIGLNDAGDVEPRPEDVARPSVDRRAGRRYELLEEIGRGGMGIVYRAVDHELEEHIAIKHLTPRHAASERHVRRFKHEVKVARRLTHPNIMRLHDLIELDGRPCLSMELVEGEGLDVILKQRGRLSPERATTYLSKLASALELAHGMGIVHRDLKPANVIIDAADEPKILDFGIAKSLWLNEAPSNMVVGTPAYMAPEQCVRGSAVDGRADLYSLGIMLYQMVCGRVPFDHQDPIEIMRMQRSLAPLPPVRLIPSLPERLEQVILRLLEKDPDKRFQCSSDLMPAIAALRPVASAIGNQVGHEPRRRSTVLVATGDSIVRGRLRQRLVDAATTGGRVPLDLVEARHGAEALELALQRKPDLILLGMQMPFLDGPQVLRLVRNNMRTREIPVILLFEAKRPRQGELAATMGAASHLSQPFERAAVEHALARFLA